MNNPLDVELNLDLPIPDINVFMKSDLKSNIQGKKKLYKFFEPMLHLGFCLD